ncbi:hypothetical protein [Streptomyces sp. BH105]|uniref:hypothetical protein n=1 Tax=Streptomyces sp. BH105 TaxID=3410408 RepID=UPI003CE96747
MENPSVFSQPGELDSSTVQRIAAAQAKARAGGARSAAVRYKFIARDSPDENAPPLARLLRGGGGRGGATRLKLYLSMLWLSRNEDSPRFDYPAHQWAQLLGFDDPDAAGARRIQQALRWLDDEGLVRRQHRQGAPSSIYLLSDAGTGRPYQAPGPAMKRLTRSEKLDHLYVQLSAGLWTNGWVMELSGAAIAMYLVLLHERRGEEDKVVWISPRIGKERYDLSDETRRKGLNELAQHRLVSVRKRPLHQGLFEDHIRSRNVYEFNPQDLDQFSPGQERSPWLT